MNGFELTSCRWACDNCVDRPGRALITGNQNWSLSLCTECLAELRLQLNGLSLVEGRPEGDRLEGADSVFRFAMRRSEANK